MKKITLSILSILLFSCNSKEQKQTKPSFDYYTFKEDIYNGIGKTYVTQYLIIKDDSITKERLEDFMLEMTHSTDTLSSIKNKSNPKKVVIYVFDDEEKAKSEVKGWIGMSFKKINEDLPEITIDEKRLSMKSKEAQVKFGLSENQRKVIFNEVISIEKNAEIKAEKKYPLKNTGRTVDEINRLNIENRKNIDKNYAYEKQIINDEKAILIKKYNITEKDLDEITFEGLENDW